MSVTLEVIAATVSDALAAAEGGANRLELLANLAAGGVTPGFPLIQAVRRATTLPLYVMIRPRPGAFVYSPAEVAQMCDDARIARELGADGIVLGALTAGGTIDTVAMEQILRAASLPATFHRAFEALRHPLAALTQMHRLPGVERVLTSGGGGRPAESLAQLKALVAASGTLEVMVGGGVTLENAAAIVQATGVRAIHTGTAVREPQSAGGVVSARRVRQLRERLEGAE